MHFSIRKDKIKTVLLTYRGGRGSLVWLHLAPEAYTC